MLHQLDKLMITFIVVIAIVCHWYRKREEIYKQYKQGARDKQINVVGAHVLNVDFLP